MRDYLGYEIVKISKDVKEDKLKKAVRSGKITWSAEDLKGSVPLLVHPLQAKLIKKAQLKGKGVTSMMIAGSDILYDMQLHKDKSIWKWMDEMKTKKAYNWVFETQE